MMEDEVLLALEQAFPAGDHPPLVWFESGLHDRPEKLQLALQALIDTIDAGIESGETIALPSVRPGIGPAESRREWIETPPVDEVLLALGYCGKGLQGLVAEPGDAGVPPGRRLHLALLEPRLRARGHPPRRPDLLPDEGLALSPELGRRQLRDVAGTVRPREGGRTAQDHVRRPTNASR